jgi:hypothetical protein
MSKIGRNIVRRATKKIGRLLTRMLSVLVKKTPMSKDEFEALVVSATKFCCSTDYARELLRKRCIIISTPTDNLFAYLKENYPEQVRDIISLADDLLDNRVTLLGFEPHQFDGKFEWNKDFVSGITWRSDYYLSVPLIMWENKSDIKVPWELSRCQYLVWLAQAFRLTNDARYANKIVELVESWIESNPYPYGPNWTCAMEVAIRMLNWITALEIVGKCEAISDEFCQKTYQSLFQHAVFIDENLEKIGYGLNTNHYLADLLGLLAAGRLFRELPQGEKWLRMSKAELEREIMSQTLSDGFCHESSLNYHMLTLEMYLTALAIESRYSGFSEDYCHRLKQMVHITWALTKPDGTLPNLGDGDSGRILILDGDPAQKPSRLVDHAAYLLESAEHRGSASSPPYDAVLIAGADSARETFERAESTAKTCEQSAYFEPSGLVSMRKNGLFLFFAANPIGSGGLGGHKHNDMLSIEISCDKTNFVIDSGTCTYTSDQVQRNAFRGTESHSVPAVRGVEQNRFLPRLLFAIRSDAEVRVTNWESTQVYDLVEAEHSGYTRLEDPMLVLRKIYFDRKHELWVICDSFCGSGEYDFENNLVIGDAVLEIVDDSRVLLRSTKSSDTMEICSMTPLWRPTAHEHFVSSTYGQRTGARKLVYKLSDRAPQSMIWAAIPNAECERDKRIGIAKAHADELGWTADSGLRHATAVVELGSSHELLALSTA